MWSRFGVEHDFVDTAELSLVRAALRENTKLLFIETPANPNLRITGIAACAEIAHTHGALLVVDNTFMSPILQRPIAHGADVALHSVTKFLNGHSDVVGGMLVFADAALMDNLRLMTLAVSLGGVETLIQHPASMTHAGMTREQRYDAGISDGLVRLSVGCEDLEDLTADLEQALAQ
jgi:cystathionine beta-lyase/cystathionine gamma-synthase